MKRLFFTLYLIFQCSALCYAQHYKNFTINPGIDTTSEENKKLLSFWDAYLSSEFKNNDFFWDKTELEKYPKGDLLLNEGYIQPNIYSFGTNKVILSVEEIDSLYKVKTLFYWEQKDDSVKTLNVLCIINTYFKKGSKGLSLYNNLTQYTREWKSEKVGNILFKYPAFLSLNRDNAIASQSFLDGIFKEFDIEPFDVTYYMASNCNEVMKMKGFDYVVGMGTSSICGFYDDVNHIVYAGGQDEIYIHELTHVINSYFPDAHPLFLAGYSALKGGHHGKPLSYHKKRLKDYLKTKKHISLDDPLSFNYLDNTTNPQYVIGAIFCEIALKKGGVGKLKKLFSYGRDDNDFYTALREELKIDDKQLNKFIRRYLEKN